MDIFFFFQSLIVNFFQNVVAGAVGGGDAHGLLPATGPHPLLLLQTTQDRLPEKEGRPGRLYRSFAVLP